jgi:diguanylate cyclase (GGDEF)-like protein
MPIFSPAESLGAPRRFVQLIDIWVATVLVTVVGLFAVFPPNPVVNTVNSQLALVAFGACYLAMTRFILHYEVARHTVAASLVEVPLVAAVFFMPVRSIAAAIIVARALHGLWVGNSLKKSMLNLGVSLFELWCLSAALTLVHNPHFSKPSAWLTALAASAVSNVLAATMVFVAIKLIGSAITVRNFYRTLPYVVLGSSVATCIGFIALLVWEHNKPGTVLLGVVTSAFLIFYVTYARLRNRYGSLELLQDFTGGLVQASMNAETVETVLSATRRVLSAEHAELAIIEDGAIIRQAVFDDAGFHYAPGVIEVGDLAWASCVGGRQPLLISQATKVPLERWYLEKTGHKDILVMPLFHAEKVSGLLLVADRAAQFATFTAAEQNALETIANHASVTLENARLLKRVHDQIEQREYEATHDPLTQLPNRLLFKRHVGEALEAMTPDHRMAVMILDLNRFKEINDTLGHVVGDEVLTNVAKRLRNAIPKNAILARLGGDEFAILATHVEGTADTIELTEKLQHSLKTPIALAGANVFVDASIGVVLSPDHGVDVFTLMKRADSAMYTGKARGGSVVELFRPENEGGSARQLTLCTDLRSAIEKREIDVVFQPKANLANGTVLSFEALARWTHPTFGFISPDEFIPLAEQIGVIMGLTDVVLSKAARQCAAWRNVGFELTVAVNLSARSFQELNLGDRVAAILEREGLPAQALVLELTESELMTKAAAAAPILEAMRATGVAFSIDDFGTGYSSLSYLAVLPVDEVKIDKSFVFPLGETESARAVVRAIIELGHSLGLRVVAEGVETLKHWRILAELGCDIAQGYYLGRPMSGESTIEWLRAYKPEDIAPENAIAATPDTARPIRALAAVQN